LSQNEVSIPLVVLTSSLTKFEHIRFLCALRGVNAIRIPFEYPEAQEDDMRAQLEFASKNIRDKLPYRDAFYALEQTAVYFHSYGSRARRPGFFFKQWWETKTLREFKRLMQADSRATIESGVALLIPRHDPIVFLNQQQGHVSFEGSIRPENRKYSWLSSDDFNRYFVPQRANQVYDAMPLSAFLKYDFRLPNIERVSERLSEYEALLSANISIENIRRIAASHPAWAEKQSRLDHD